MSHEVLQKQKNFDHIGLEDYKQKTIARKMFRITKKCVLFKFFLSASNNVIFCLESSELYDKKKQFY